MGNRITNKHHPALDDLKMSNGLTSAFLHVLVLNASALAESDREKELVIWLARRNQGILGFGAVDFDIRHIPWSSEFETEKLFLLRSAEAAASKRLWDKLDYEPIPERVIPALDQFRKLIDAFQKDDIDPARLTEWSKEGPHPLTKCPQHDVYQVSWNNDGSLDSKSCLLCSDL